MDNKDILIQEINEMLKDALSGYIGDPVSKQQITKFEEIINEYFSKNEKFKEALDKASHMPYTIIIDEENSTENEIKATIYLYE